MPIQSFDIGNVKILKKASCERVPKLMVIAGPNGVGKSTLIYELRKFSGDKVKGTGKILYAGPHRSWRRRTIRSSWLWSQETQYSDLLTLDSLPGFEGIHVLDGTRRPDTTDEAPGFIKYTLAQIETKRQNAIVSEIDRNNLKYPEGFAPDIYKPLRNLIELLLPHLRFMGVDQSNRNNVKCLLKPEGANEALDIDDLSSGEKEIIALFMPLIEREISTILRRIRRGKEPNLDITPDTVMLMDEPDLHVHPELQKRMIKYMRKRAYEGNVQFIVATHSPVFINAATSEELFVLVEKDLTGDKNQLHRVLSNQEKLDLFKYVCGDVAILTLGRPIVFIEGKKPMEIKNAPSDQRILELLWDGARDFTFIPMGGREEVEKATIVLNQILTEKLIGFPACAIVDADLDIAAGSSSSLILKWPFCTIENVLLDSLSIFETLDPFREKTQVFSKEDVEKKLLAICEEISQDEFKKRLRIFPSLHLTFDGKSIKELVEQRDASIERLKELFADPDEIRKQIQRIEEDIKTMIQNKTALQKFNGKAILGKFYQKHIQEKGIKMGFDVFCYSIAERMGKNDRTPKSIEETLNSIKDSLASIVPNQPTSQ